MAKFKLDADLIDGSKKHKVAVQTQRNQRRALVKKLARQGVISVQVVFTKQGIKQTALLTFKTKERVVEELRLLADQLEDSNGNIMNIMLNHSVGFGVELTIETRVMENDPRTKTNRQKVSK